MRIGVSLTRDGIDGAQYAGFKTALAFLRIHGATELHHGDCKGGDAQADELARTLGLRVVVHPPEDDRLQAHCTGDEKRPPRPYLLRNRCICWDTDVLVAAPKTPLPSRGGTWATVGYAQSLLRPTVLALPGGLVEPAVRTPAGEFRVPLHALAASVIEQQCQLSVARIATLVMRCWLHAVRPEDIFYESDKQELAQRAADALRRQTGIYPWSVNWLGYEKDVPSFARIVCPHRQVRAVNLKRLEVSLENFCPLCVAPSK